VLGVIALMAFLRADLVDCLGWLTEHELWNAIAVGQMTPGPVFTTATFVGYVLAGPVGALVATAGIFLPAFICRDKRSPRASSATVGGAE
jgi:chromate transporter